MMRAHAAGALLAALPLAAALDNGVGRTPPLGWSSWNHFAAHISSDILKQAADAMASNGLRDAGFEYINLGAQPPMEDFSDAMIDAMAHVDLESPRRESQNGPTLN